jgi:chemotaxis protein histidine kinase CheA
MKQMDVFKKIGGILKELNDQYDYLAADPGELNELELELFVANAHFLKDHAEILRRINERAATPVPPAEKPQPLAEQPKPEPIQPVVPKPAPPPAPKPEALHEQRFFEPVVQQQHIPVPVNKIEITKEAEPVAPVPFNNPVKIDVVPAEVEIKKTPEPEPQIDLASATDKDSYSFQQEIPEGKSFELDLNEADTWEDDADEFEQKELTNEVPEKAAEPAVVAAETKAEPETKQSEVQQPVANNTKADTDAQQVLTFNQRMAQKTEKPAGNSNAPAELPVTDLKSAINLNDKLLYIKDLFNGYSLAYSEAIEIVNRFNTFEEAERFLKTNYVVKNNWENKPSTTEKFYALLKRRYPNG